jgi:hypothetical protein
MAIEEDIELGEPSGSEEYKSYDTSDASEHHALLPSPNKHEHRESPSRSDTSFHAPSKFRFTILRLVFAFLGGVIATLLAQYAVLGSSCCPRASSPPGHKTENVLAPTYVGSTERHHFPPPSPTNAFPSLFPSDVGYAGPTPTGAEPALVVTAPSYPIHSGAAQLVVPTSLTKEKGGNKDNFDLLKYWGNLSPWYSVERGAFGVDSGPEVPDTCRVTGLHFLHRHGARYPTGYGKYSSFWKGLVD